jgi:hypothetical protein
MIDSVITEQFVFYLIAFAIGFLAFHIAISGFRPIWRLPFRRTRRKKSPINDDLLNYPGKSLADRIQNEIPDAIMLSIFLMLTPPFLLLIFSVFPKHRTVGFAHIILNTATLIITALFCWKVHSKFRQIRVCRMGLDGERATGEELNQLMKQGYRVYHDLQADKFNIDHIVIGPSGVYAVETKYRAKMNGNGNGAKVDRNSETLRFPDNRFDNKTIPQARAQAKWLEEFLSKSVGKHTPVQAMVALPGWYVEKGPHDGSVLVISPKNPDKFFLSRHVILDEQTIQQVAYQVEQRCRNVKPIELT